MILKCCQLLHVAACGRLLLARLASSMFKRWRDELKTLTQTLSQQDLIQQLQQLLLLLVDLVLLLVLFLLRQQSIYYCKYYSTSSYQQYSQYSQLLVVLWYSGAATVVATVLLASRVVVGVRSSAKSLFSSLEQVMLKFTPFQNTFISTHFKTCQHILFQHISTHFKNTFQHQNNLIQYWYQLLATTTSSRVLGCSTERSAKAIGLAFRVSVVVLTLMILSIAGCVKQFESCVDYLLKMF